jgi:hypothetical protein
VDLPKQMLGKTLGLQGSRLQLMEGHADGSHLDLLIVLEPLDQVLVPLSQLLRRLLQCIVFVLPLPVLLKTLHGVLQ